MTGYSWALQQAVYGVLSGANIAGGNVFDAPPQSGNTPFPYVQIGETQIIPDDLSPGDDGLSELLTLHVWSRHRGQKEVKQIVAEISAALHGAALDVPGRASALAWVRTSRSFIDPDGLTRHGVMDIEIIHRS